MRAVILGTAVLEFLALVERLPGGEPAGGGCAGLAEADGTALDVVATSGGAGATMALAAARLGVATGLAARLGGDSAAHVIMQRLRDGGVDLLLPPRRGARTDRRIGHVTRAGDARASLLAAAGALVEPADVATLADQLRAADIVVASTAAPTAAVAAALRSGRAAGALTVLRAAPPCPAAADLLGSVDVLSVDPAGACAYAGIRPGDRPSAYRAARILLGRGPGVTAVGAGPAGTLVAWPEGHCWLAGAAGPRLMAPAGAADAFTAVLAVALAEGRPVAAAAEYAGAAAVLAARSLSPQDALPGRDEIAALLGGHAPPLRPPRRASPAPTPAAAGRAPAAPAASTPAPAASGRAPGASRPAPAAKPAASRSAASRPAATAHASGRAPAPAATTRAAPADPAPTAAAAGPQIWIGDGAGRSAAASAPRATGRARVTTGPRRHAAVRSAAATNLATTTLADVMGRYPAAIREGGVPAVGPGGAAGVARRPPWWGTVRPTVP